MTKKLIYHLAAIDDWNRALKSGVYDGSPNDKADGFIHFSAADQVKNSAAKYRAGRTDQILLILDPDSLGPALRWEPSHGGILFPHLYAALPVSAVQRTVPLPLGEYGVHLFPALDV